MPDDAATRRYSVVATDQHLDAMARLSATPRLWGPVVWLGVPVALWLGLLLSSSLMPAAVRQRLPLMGLSVLVLGGAIGWLMAVYLRRTVRRRMRRALEEGGWHVGSEHEAVFSDTGFTLSGPASEMADRYDHFSWVLERDGAVLLRRRESRAPVLSVAELFPPQELERVRRGIADARDA